jgi:hypothetical protein
MPGEIGNRKPLDISRNEQRLAYHKAIIRNPNRLARSQYQEDRHSCLSGEFKERINATDRNVCPPDIDFINYVNYEALD